MPDARPGPTNIGRPGQVDAFAGIIPAAGASRRMGTPKAFLELDGESFLRRVIATLRTAGCAPVLAVVRPDDEPARIEAEASGARPVLNPEPGDGPITSLRCALAALDPLPDGLVWLPLDHPVVAPGTVAALIAAARASSAPLALPVHRGKRGHPAVFQRSVYDELLAPDLVGGARTVVHRHLKRAILFETDDPGVLVDVDTPEEYRQLGSHRS